MEAQGITYIGCFVDRDELLKLLEERGLSEHLSNIIDCPHVTLKYKPDELHEELFGGEVRIEAFAYGNDGCNEGLAVTVHTDDETLKAMLAQVPVPHITVSIAEDAEAVDTARIQFERIEPFTIKGYFGGFCLENGPVIDPTYWRGRS